MQIKLHLHKFENNLALQIVDFQNHLINKGFLDMDNRICVINDNSWSKNHGLRKAGIGCNIEELQSNMPTFYINMSEKGKIHIYSLESNVERDDLYNRILKSFELTVKHNSWISTRD